MYFRQYFQPFFTTMVNARLYWYDHKFKSMWKWSVMLLQFGMYWIEIFFLKNHYPRNRAARYCAVLQFILLIKQSLTGVVKTKPLIKRKFIFFYFRRHKRRKWNKTFILKVVYMYNIISRRKKTPKPGNLNFKWLLSLRVSKKSNKWYV